MSVCCMSSSVNNSPEQIISPNLWRFLTRKSCKLVANSQARTTRQDSKTDWLWHGCVAGPAHAYLGVLRHSLGMGDKIVRKGHGTRSSMISSAIGNEQDPNPLPPKFKNFASGKISLFTDGPLLFNFLFALHPHKTCNTRGIRHSLLSIFFLNLPCCKTHCNSAQISSGFLLVAKEIFSLLFYKNLVFKNNLFTGYCFFSSAASIHRNQYD